MVRPKRDFKTVLAFVSALGVSLVLSQCTARSTPFPVQVLPGSATPTRTAKPTKTVPVIRTEVSATPRPVTATPTLGPTFTQFPTVPEGIPILSPGGPGAATNLESQPSCRGSVEPIAYLSWTLAAERGSAQQIDVTTLLSGFEAEVFETTGPIAPGQADVLWEKVIPGVIHYWRVLTLHENGWVPSEVATFNGSVCIQDIAPTPVP